MVSWCGDGLGGAVDRFDVAYVIQDDGDDGFSPTVGQLRPHDVCLSQYNCLLNHIVWFWVGK